MLRAAAIAAGLLSCVPAVASAQSLNATAQTGRALVNQHCGVCHTKPDLEAKQFGPSLDKSLLGSASAADIKKFIAQGSPDMPGFAFTLDPTQIDAIVAYIREAPAAPASTPARNASAPPAAAASGGDN